MSAVDPQRTVLPPAPVLEPWPGGTVLTNPHTGKRPDGCARLSSGLAEPMVASAGLARVWVLVEHPGPWPMAAPVGLLPEAVSEHLDVAGVRVVLVRRPRRRSQPPVAAPVCFVVSTDPRGPWARRLDGPAESLLDVDLAGVLAGEGTAAGVPHAAPLVLVCTHGRRDACCAEFGRPLLGVLDARRDADVWECTHVGGDRFAANVVLLPHGLHYSRLDAASATAAVDAYLDGEVLLDHLRGRSAFTQPGQVAEHAVRRLTGSRVLDDVIVLAEGPAEELAEEPAGQPAEDVPPVTRVRVAHAGREFLVRTHQEPTPGTPASHGCVRGGAAVAWASWQLDSITEVGLATATELATEPATETATETRTATD